MLAPAAADVVLAAVVRHMPPQAGRSQLLHSSLRKNPVADGHNHDDFEVQARWGWWRLCHGRRLVPAALPPSGI